MFFDFSETHLFGDPADHVPAKTLALIDAYNQGFETGMMFKYKGWNYVPAGPLVYDEQSDLENAAWRKGWRFAMGIPEC